MGRTIRPASAQAHDVVEAARASLVPRPILPAANCLNSRRPLLRGRGSSGFFVSLKRAKTATKRSPRRDGVVAGREVSKATTRGLAA
jgi:hypothetical protein